jgi:hypothetical protein
MAADVLYPAAAAVAAAVDDASLLASQSSCSIAMRLVGMPQGTFAECVATGEASQIYSASYGSSYEHEQL